MIKKQYKAIFIKIMLNSRSLQDFPSSAARRSACTGEPFPSLLRTSFFVRKQSAQLKFNALQSAHRAGNHRFHFPAREYGLVVRRRRLRMLRFAVFIVDAMVRSSLHNGGLFPKEF
jgi:hypothetical protein